MSTHPTTTFQFTDDEVLTLQIHLRTSLNLSLERHGELVVLGDKKGQEHAMKECKSLLSLIGKVG